ncbi:hypothetical protein EJ03DRAFT_349259 [Teratosphaeria nubilosa]|uniref:Peptidase M48 domain-containing protein n=1 Tax=Teratosphaeria nubilosa TaxID=161662 RepID=A0A6G1LGD8_9PEZI|nr:hypothetical protein EJ03DRAFT_349259 [Teratosphaeria nubilosa]
MSPAAAGIAFRLYGSRQMESEADFIGLLLMADAGYDPTAAAVLCRELATKQEQQHQELVRKHGVGKVRRLEEWQRTHPNDEKRLKKLKESIPSVTANTVSAGSECSTLQDENFKLWRDFLAERDAYEPQDLERLSSPIYKTTKI